MSDDLFYIHNAGTNGNCMRFWRVDGGGYTVDLDDAWKVDYEKAKSICSCRPKEDFAYPVALVDSLAKRHIDIQALRKAVKA